MPPEPCAAHRFIEEAQARIFAALEKIGSDTRDEIAAMREAVQGIDRAVAQIKGHLGINGLAPSDPHPYRRTSDSDSHLHQRLQAIEDKLSAPAPKGDGITLPRWAAAGLAAGFVICIVLALYAGNRHDPHEVIGAARGAAGSTQAPPPPVR